MILNKDMKVLTKSGLKDYRKPNVRFYLNETTLSKTVDYKTIPFDYRIYSIYTKNDKKYDIIDDGKQVFTSRGFVRICDLDVGDTLISYSMRGTDYGASSMVLNEEKIVGIECDPILVFSEGIEVPYEEIISDGLLFRA